MKTVTFTVPALSPIKTSYREDGSPKAHCFVVGEVSWECDGLRYTLSPFTDDDGKILQYVRISRTAEVETESVLAHFETTGTPSPKKERKPKKSIEQSESEIV